MFAAPITLQGNSGRIQTAITPRRIGSLRRVLQKNIELTCSDNGPKRGWLCYGYYSRACPESERGSPPELAIRYSHQGGGY